MIIMGIKRTERSHPMMIIALLLPVGDWYAAKQMLINARARRTGFGMALIRRTSVLEIKRTEGSHSSTDVLRINSGLAATQSD